MKDNTIKINNEALDYILNVVKTAQLLGIESVIIEPGKVRGLDDSKRVVLHQDKNVPQLSFNSIGLNRISTFISRIDIARSSLCENTSFEAIVEDIYVRAIQMKGKGIKIDYRCANPTTIQAPKEIKDILKYQFQIPTDAVMLMVKGKTAMQADIVTFLCNENGVSFELADINSDVLSHLFADRVTHLTADTNAKFAHRYPLDLILTILKGNQGDKVLEIGQKGILKTTVNNLGVYILPQVD